MLGQQLELAGHRGAGNQAVIRVHGAEEAHLVQQPKRVFRHVVADTRLRIRGRADLQSNALVAHEAGDRTQLNAAHGGIKVLVHTHAVTDTSGALR